MKNLSFILLLFVISINQTFSQSKTSDINQDIFNSIERHSSNLINISDEIWNLAETAFNEHKSSKILADYATENGFSVEMGVADMPTAFVATYGKGNPVISVLGEFDALPGISQETKPTKSPLVEGGAGHGCGHNLFGAGSLGAAIAIKELIESGKISGTVKFFGTPSEEKYFGKIWMLKEGLWDDVDVNISWHPAVFHLTINYIFKDKY